MGLKKFKIGDKVKLTKNGCIGWEGTDWTNGMQIGEETEIRGIGCGLSVRNVKQPYVDVKGSIYSMHPNHFTKVKSNKKPN